ncbi:MAG: hypothetical protein RI947_249 [Candidatus Parcubacteria bacterium]|jgi:uncharacterized protein YcaQ
MVLKISKKSARQFLLKKQLLLPPRSLTGKKAIEEVFQTLRLIQYDPLNPCGRNADLVLQARIADYHPSDYYSWLYDERKGIECYDKELCIVPIEDLPFISHRHAKARKHPVLYPFISKHKKELEELLIKIDKGGPITSADIKDARRANIFWSEEQWGRAALESMWKVGRLAIVKRHNGKKYYDLPHKVYTSFHTEDKISATIQDEHILRRIGSVGMLRKSGSGGGWQGMGTAKDVSLVIKRLLEKKQLVEVKVEDSIYTYVINSKDKALFQKGIDELPSSAVFLAPLDNLMWDREMIDDLFHFYYRWEVYTPLHKRVYGYYVLPILWGDTFIGRIEPVLQKDGTLVIKNVWKEENVSWDKPMQMAFDKALVSFKQYVKAKEMSRHAFSKTL